MNGWIVSLILLVAALLSICLGGLVALFRMRGAEPPLPSLGALPKAVAQRAWSYRWRILLGAAGFAAILGYYYQTQYPYGWSHCCDKVLSSALERYANAHGGWFPRGEATPEASLSLLYTQQHELADILRGKTVPKSVVLARLENGQLLTPETCGWHYVEGLRSDDDPQLALFWDKAGLGHNGQRLPQGGHWVGRVLGTVDYVPEPQWTRFLEEQTRLREAIRRSPG